MRNVGTVVRGIRTPIIKENDNLEDIVVTALLEASKSEGFSFRDKDVVLITEAVVGISEGNFATVDQISSDLKNKFNTNHIGVINPVLSRNRFALLLRGIARSMDKITIQLSFPSDEVGNDIMFKSDLEKYNIKLGDVITEEEYNTKLGHFKHMFTGVNMVEFYRDVCNKEDCEVEFVFSNDPKTILGYEKDVLVCDIHARKDTKDILKANGNGIIIGLDEVLTESVDGSGYNSKYGLLGSNRSTEDRVKLFPRTGDVLVNNIQKRLKELTSKDIEVMVYGDGAFKDPVGKIWELADPVVSPFYTKGLEGSPNELKLKYLSDNKFSDLRGQELLDAMKAEIRNKDANLVGKMETQGTTPRRYTDLLGSLADLTSGSGDKGTPVVFIQGYFDNLASE